MSLKRRNYSVWISAASIVAILAFIALAASCSKSPSAAEPVQKTFASREQAEAALIAASKSDDQTALIEIFGPDSRAVLFTGAADTDKARLNDFVTAYNQMHRWEKIRAGGQVLMVGADNDPFPIPLDQNSSGRWYFDTAAGKDEILARRIGKNELTAMDASQALAAAEHQYFQEKKQYAQKFFSDPGKQNGLFWPPPEGQTPSPLGQLGDFAKASNSGGNPEFNGYYYRILTKAGGPSGSKDYVVNGRMTGGFAILAYPVEYRNSGVMSFLVSEDGTVYQKDLGESTGNVAASMTTYNPSDGWTPAMTSPTTASRIQP